MPQTKAPAKRSAKHTTHSISVKRTRIVSKNKLREHYCAQFPKGFTPPPASTTLLHEMGISQYRFTRILDGAPLLADEALAYCHHFKVNPETIVQFIPARKTASHD